LNRLFFHRTDDQRLHIAAARIVLAKLPLRRLACGLQKMFGDERGVLESRTLGELLGSLAFLAEALPARELSYKPETLGREFGALIRDGAAVLPGDLPQRK
jgi:hypothetical protein